MNYSILLLLALLSTVAYLQTPPRHPDQFEIEFNETATLGLATGMTKGKLYYDWINRLEVVYRENGRYDRYCGTVEKFSSIPCNHYITSGRRYLDFPTKRYCCFCCDSSHGCGILRPDWLSNATYLGLEKLDTASYEKWDMKGLQDNYYYNTHDAKQTPRRLDQKGDDVMDFIGSTYKLGITDPEVFHLPEYCTATCGLTTVCATLRGEKASLQTE